ncbi:MAG TPA: hypothetical protein VLH08_02995 [Acidobacteriota bacterium]|nr:hypothetical protein [Acidobacteriota bacterium]
MRLRLTVRRFLLTSAIFLVATNFAISKEVHPIFEFPEKGMDDPAKYENYVTRFYKDSSGNSFQIYIDQKSGRVVHVWADAANESVGFTVRNAAGAPAEMKWDSSPAIVTAENNTRSVQHVLSIHSPSIQIGHTILASMRKERDFQYFKKHLEPYDAQPYHDEELKKLISNLGRIPANIRAEHLQILKAKDINELHARLDPSRSLVKSGDGWIAKLKQPYFDEKNQLTLEFIAGAAVNADLTKNVITFRSVDQTSDVKITVKVSTDSPALTALDQNNIFNEQFNQFYASQKTGKDPVRFKWLERERKAFELLSSQEKLMAGLPNFATYFGRDTMMASLMMEPIWKGSMLEHAIGSVLNKLRADGAVSHEEALGGQAIKENADEYNKTIDRYFSNQDPKVIAEAAKILKNLNAVRENYRMVDDDFQLPVLVGKYLQRKDVTTEQRRNYLLRKSRQDVTYLSLLISNLIYAVNQASPYIENPISTNLVSFLREDGKCISGSWRDSGVGYAGGCFAMDVNVVWVPETLEALGIILPELEKVGFGSAEIESRVPEIKGTKLQQLLQNPEALKKAIQTWKASVKHFQVHLDQNQIQQGINAKLAWLPESERSQWQKVAANTTVQGLDFLALSLDQNGKPIPVINSDNATYLFIEDFTDEKEVTKLASVFDVAYPFALFVDGLGPLCANDTFASPEVWEMFKNDLYHSPRVVWGREVNLVQLGLMKQINAFSTNQELQNTLDKTVQAVEASGLKHNELWTYKIDATGLKPVRYGTSTDLQLWNLTDLAVQYLLNSTSGGPASLPASKNK